MGSIVVGAVYDMLNNVTFSGMRIEGHHLAFADRMLLNPHDFAQKQGDSSTRIMVVGYSNKERAKKAEIEAAILAADRTGRDFRVYEGCRSSTIDVLNIARNQFDAYVDARALWPQSGAMLYPYDIAGVIPVALGCGLVVTDAYGNPVNTYSAKNVPLSVIIARPKLHPQLVEAIRSALPKRE
jgi:fructose-1,6-bisphosphatase/inositol monophosphatase family enzyme